MSEARIARDSFATLARETVEASPDTLDALEGAGD